MGVDHGGADVFVPQQFLDGADVVAIFEQMGGEAVAEGMAGDALVEPGQASGFLDRFLHAALAKGP